MPTYQVNSVESLREAFKKAKDKEDVIVTFSVPLIDFSDSDGGRHLKLTKGDHGIKLIGPVTLRGVQFWFERIEDPIVLENIRVRVGAKNLEKDNPMDALFAEKCDEIYLRHCTFSDSSDEIISLNYCDHVEITQCIIADPLHIPTVDNKGEEFIHSEGKQGSHGYGLRSSAIKNLVINETIFGNLKKRSPQCNNKNVREDTIYRFNGTNNVIYNYGDHGFVYNNKEKEEEEGAKYIVDFHHNLFVPGPRTLKTRGDSTKAKEFDCEQPDSGMKFQLKNIGTNQIHGYLKLYCHYNGEDFHVDSGSGPTLDRLSILDNAGCHPHDQQDQDLVASVKTALVVSHEYDNLEQETVHLAWPASGWKNY